MPIYANATSLTFDGTVSTATQYSNAVNLTQTRGNSHAWFFTVNVTAAGVMGITLQFNPDPFNLSNFGWQDVTSSTDIKIFDIATQAFLAQTDAGISGGLIRGGIIDATGDFDLLLKFAPLPYSYRLKFQLDATLEATIPRISFTQGS